MPKVEPDAALQDRLITYLRKRSLNVAQAARELGLDRVSLWRFSKTGKARADRRQAYREALDRATARPVHRHQAKLG